MKKTICLCAAVLCLTGCLNGPTEDHTPVAVNMTTDVYVLNGAGSQSGSLTDVRLDDWTVNQEAFKLANGRNLGSSPTSAIIYGTKMYIVVSGENTVEVVDRNTLKSLRSISTTDLMGDGNGKQPHSIVSGYGNVYVSTSDGYVEVIDTAKYELAKCYDLDAHPEGMVISSKGTLYVALTDSLNPKVVGIGLSDDKVSTFAGDYKCPVSFAMCNGNLYLLDKGDGSENACVYVLNSNKEFEKAYNGETQELPATMMSWLDSSSFGRYLYLVSGTWTNPTYRQYQPYGSSSPLNGSSRTFIEDGPKNPVAIAVDDNTGYVYILSGSAGEQGSLWVYDYSGNLIKKVAVGQRPVSMTFNHNTVYY